MIADFSVFHNPDLPNTRSEAALPLKSRGETIGILDVQSTAPGAFSNADLQTLTALANQVSIAFENARLLTETRAALTQVQEVYNEFMRAEWSRATSHAEQAGFRYHAGRIELLENELRTSEVVSAVENGQVAVQHANGSKEKRAAVAVPVKLRGEVIGVLHIESNDSSREWQEDEITLVDAVAERAAENSSGYDIIFRDASDLKLDHEIEKYDGATGTLVAWVKIPTLANNANTTITMYYGNKGVTTPTQNAPGVWNNGFREVWHLRETSGGTVADSTASAYTGTASAGVNQNPATEKIDGADEFNGTNGVLTLSDGTLTANSPFTIEAWFRLRNLPAAGRYAGIVTKNRDQAEPIDDWVGLYVVGGSPTLLTRTSRSGRS